MSNKSAKVVLVGLANSGKSTLFNRLSRSNQAITSDIAHTTRDTNRKLVTRESKSFELVDTAGYSKDEAEITVAAMSQLQAQLADADLILFVVDGTVLPSEEAKALAKVVRKHAKPTLLIKNKIDNLNSSIAIEKFRSLGIEPILSVSAEHNLGIEDLFATIFAQLSERSTKKPKPFTREPIRVALLGRPNVGKSSLLNALAGEKLAIEAGQAGTTRDTNQFSIEYQKNELVFIDTAGLRRPGKIAKGENVEFYSKVRTEKAIDNADLCLLLIDANDLVTSQDQHLIGLIEDNNKGLIVVVTKWDMIEKDTHTMAEMSRIISSRLPFAAWAPLIFTSAKDSQNLTQLKKLIVEVSSRMNLSIPTAKLNRFLQDANAKNPPSAVKTRRPKVNYATQTNVRPPEFTIFTTHPEYMHFSYTRYIENQLRSEYELEGVPVAIIYKSKYKEGNRDRYKGKK